MVSLILHVQYNYTTVTLTNTHTQLIVNIRMMNNTTMREYIINTGHITLHFLGRNSSQI